MPATKRDEDLVPGLESPLPLGDGVVGDVVLTVMLAAAVAGIVAALLYLLWRSLPSVSVIAQFIGGA